MYKLNISSELEVQSTDNSTQNVQPIRYDYMDETDMFADLEKTLCESIFNSTRNAKALTINQPSEQDLIDCLENVKDLGRIHGPAVRAYNLYKATKAFKEKRYLDSIYCETFAMSLWMRIKFHANKVMEAERHIPTEENLFDFLEQQVEGRPRIIDYIDRFLKYDLKDEGTSTLKNIEFTNGTELMNLCNELPKEWTVIQLCKQVNLEIFTQTRNEALRCPCLIFMTIFCYPMSERFNHQPIKIPLNQKDLKDLYEISRDYSEKMHNSDLYSHFKKISNEQFDSEIVSKLKQLLGPWIVFFSGKSKNEVDKRYENKMIAKVDQFLSKSEHKYSSYQNVLICLLARRLYMLTRDDIKEGALYISTTKDEWFELMDFFYEQENLSKTPEECYPVILVVDEQIDFFFWEMSNPAQEFTRVDSMVTLLKLFFEHQDKIFNGYFNVNQRRGSAVINPDKSLGQYSAYILPLMEQFKAPTWNILVEKIPTSTELKTMLANSDIYFYCGHNAGLQYVSSYETCQLYSNAVVFLLGCSTTEFKADTGYCLASADYQYYHLAKSPAIIGNLNISYTHLGATFANVIMTKWLCVTNKIQLNWYGKEEQQFARSSQDILAAIKGSQYLTKVVAAYRRSNCAPIAFRAILCYRGLPVCFGAGAK